MRSQWVVLGVFLAGAAASAQELQPSVVPFPLELKSAGTVSEKDQGELLVFKAPDPPSTQ